MARKRQDVQPTAVQLEILRAHHGRTDLGRFFWKDVAKAFRKQRWCCYYCGLPFPHFRRRGKPSIRTTWFQIEHKTPISRGGTNWPANICLACKTCNRLKGTKTEDEFLNGEPPGYLANLPGRKLEEPKPQSVGSAHRGETQTASEGAIAIPRMPSPALPRDDDMTSQAAYRRRNPSVGLAKCASLGNA